MGSHFRELSLIQKEDRNPEATVEFIVVFFIRWNSDAMFTAANMATCMVLKQGLFV